MAIAAGCMAGLLKIYKLKSGLDVNIRSLSENFHDTAHKLRDEHAALCKRYKNQEKKLTHEELVQNLMRVGQNVVDNLSTILNDLSGEDVNVCIKYFCIDKPIKFTEYNIQNKEDLLVTVLCRCKKSNKNKRRENTKDKLIDNTDLSAITFEKLKHFKASDLDEFSKYLEKVGKGSYRDSNPNWRSVFRSKITVPIQLDLSHSKNDYIEGKAYDLIGFITMDSLSTSAFRKDNIDYYVEIAKAFADILYRYLERYVFLSLELEKVEIRRDPN